MNVKKVIILLVLLGISSIKLVEAEITIEKIQAIWKSQENDNYQVADYRRTMSLDLSHQNLTDDDLPVVQDFVCNHKSVMYLNLSYNKLTKFNVTRFGQVLFLNLSYNQLELFTSEGLGRLVVLDLSYNQLELFTSEGLGRLDILNLSGNKMGEFRCNGLFKLSDLNLSNNQLELVDATGLPCLKILDVSHNENLHDDKIQNLNSMVSIIRNSALPQEKV